MTRRNNSRFNMIVATGYSGRWDIVQACRELAAKVLDNATCSSDRRTSTRRSPPPDLLLIRTSAAS